jgi:hypothetical protein
VLCRRGRRSDDDEIPDDPRHRNSVRRDVGAHAHYVGSRILASRCAGAALRTREEAAPSEVPVYRLLQPVTLDTQLEMPLSAVKAR